MCFGGLESLLKRLRTLSWEFVVTTDVAVRCSQLCNLPTDVGRPSFSASCEVARGLGHLDPLRLGAPMA